MRKRTAILTVVALAVITALCPPLFCAPVAESHACCPKHNPCKTHGESDQACPSLLLAKAKHVPLAVAAPPLMMQAAGAPAEYFAKVVTLPSQIRATEDLYLRNRVLLI